MSDTHPVIINTRFLGDRPLILMEKHDGYCLDEEGNRWENKSAPKKRKVKQYRFISFFDKVGHRLHVICRANEDRDKPHAEISTVDIELMEKQWARNYAYAAIGPYEFRFKKDKVVHTSTSSADYYYED